MYEISKNSRDVNGDIIYTWIRRMSGYNVLEVEAGTNAQVKDYTDKSSKTYIRIQDIEASEIKFNILGNGGCQHHGIEIEMKGDSELITMIDALEFVVMVLKIQSGKGE